MVKLTKTKDEIIKKANELAIEYEAKYKGCGECTFMAVIDALRWGDLEIILDEFEKGNVKGYVGSPEGKA